MEYLPPDNSVSLPEETIQLWKKYLEEQNRLKKEREHNEMIARLSADPNYEKYRAAVLTDGRKDTDFGFESLFLLNKYLEETPQEELEKSWKEIEDSGVGSESPTVEEYFESINPNLMYAKGYGESAAEFKKAIIEKVNELDLDHLAYKEVFIQLVDEIYNNK